MFLETLSQTVLQPDESDLVSMPQGSLEKRLLVWLIKRHTTVSNAWVSKHLHCGHPSNVNKYVQSIGESKDQRVSKQGEILLKELDGIRIAQVLGLISI